MKKLLVIMLSVFMFSCNFSKEREGEVVKNAKGEYFILSGRRVFGDETYIILPIDTNKYKTFN